MPQCSCNMTVMINSHRYCHSLLHFPCCRFDHPWKRHRWEGRKDLMSARSMYTSSPLTLNGSAFAKSRDSSPPSPSQPSHDPYEFSDESSNAGNFGRALRNREDSVSRSNSLSKNVSVCITNYFILMTCMNFIFLAILYFSNRHEDNQSDLGKYSQLLFWYEAVFS